MKTKFQMTTEDAQIAAAALLHNFILATRNTKDFLHRDQLELQNLWSLEFQIVQLEPVC